MLPVIEEEVLQESEDREATAEAAVTEAHKGVVEAEAGEDQSPVSPVLPQLPQSNETNVSQLQNQSCGDSSEESLVVKVRRCLPYWKTLIKSEFANNLIQRGLTIPFTDKLRVKRLCKYKISPRKTSARKRKVLRKELKTLLAQDVIERAPGNVPLFENYIFPLVKPSGKIRIIFYMKYLNTFIKLPKLQTFKFSKAYQAFLKNNSACRIDLSNAYWHIGVNEKFRSFLAFSFDRVTYWWKAMPFGLRTAPYLFCSIMNTVVKNIRLKFKIFIFFYMDDILILGPSDKVTKEHLEIVIRELTNAGFTINWEKSSLTPSSSITFLGIEIDLIHKTLEPSADNKKSCIEKTHSFINRNVAYLKTFQSLVGSLNFVAPYIKFGKLNLAPLHRFAIYFNNNRKKVVPIEMKKLLKFWSDLSSYVAIPIPNFCKPEITVYSDASQQGWGAQILWPHKDPTFAQGLWEDVVWQEHINVKELRAVWLTLSAAPQDFKDHVVKVHSDNKSTVAWLNKGTSTRSELARSILLKITEFKISQQCQIKAVYIKGSQNLTADALSRSSSLVAELSLKESSFAKLCSVANIFPEIDLFASSSNNKCSKYFSAAPDPEALGVNALMHCWESFKVLYAFPPSHLINKTLYKFLNSNCNNLLILVPRSATSWHRNLRSLAPIEVPFKFVKDDFFIPSQINMVNSVQNPFDLVAYLI